MTGYGPGAVVAWAAFTCTSLIVAALALHACWKHGERRLVERIEADQQLRADRYAAAAFAAEEWAARQRHPTNPLPPVQAALPPEVQAQLDALALFHRELETWDGIVEGETW